VQQGGHALKLEIKPTPGLERRAGEVVGQACRALWQASTAPRLLWSSLSPQALEGALLLDLLWPGRQGAVEALGSVAVVTGQGRRTQPWPACCGPPACAHCASRSTRPMKPGA
jgi:glycerophosphoryl diester phosphodiesterase